MSKHKRLSMVPRRSLSDLQSERFQDAEERVKTEKFLKSELRKENL